MRLLRFLIAAACGVLATVLAFEHRDSLEQLFVTAVAATVERNDLAIMEDHEANIPAPIKVMPVSEAAPTTPAEIPTPAQPRWHIVDASLQDPLREADSLTVTTVSDTATAPIAVIAATKAKPASAGAHNPKWEIIGHSAQDKPIHVRKTGSGSDVTLIVAGLDGEDRIAVKWIDQLSQRIDEAPELVADRQLILLRAVNPDGLTIKQSANGHGVMINRNFPTAGYQPGGQPSAGSGPASEPETRAVLKLLAELRPQRIIHVQSSNKTAAFSNAKSAAVVQSWQQALQSRPQSLDVQHQSGSLEEYAATVLGREVVSLQLPTGDDWRAAGLTHVPTLLAMSAPILDQSFDGTDMVALKDPATDHSLEPSPFQVSSDAEDDIAPRPQRKGYEELPPPPFKPNW